MVPDVNSHAYADQIVKLYRESMMGRTCQAGASYEMSGVPGTLTDDFKKIVDGFPHHCMMMRSQQPVVDIVLRPLTPTYIRLCVPHLKVSYSKVDPSRHADLEARLQEIRAAQMAGTATPPKWTLFEKCNASLAHSIAYAVLQCHRDYEGILIPISVSTESCDDHANMIYIDMSDAHKPSRCLLFEPNGTAFAKKYGHDQKIRKAVVDARALLQKLHPPFSDAQMLDADIHIAGGAGVQTALGVEEKTRTASGTLTKTQGHPICAAITYWMFYIWVKTYRKQFPVYKRFEDTLLKVIATNAAIRSKLKRKLFIFIHNVRDRVAKRFRTDITELYREALEQYFTGHERLNEIIAKGDEFELKVVWRMHLQPFSTEQHPPLNCEMHFTTTANLSGVRVALA